MWPPRRSRRRASTVRRLRPIEDVKFQAPLAVAIDAAGERIAVADYEGWQRVFHPRDGSADIPFGTRFMPSRPDHSRLRRRRQTIRRVGPEAFAELFWCDLAFSADGRQLLIWPHNWTSRGLGGQPFLPADETARTLYVLDIARGGLRTVRFPDAISSVDAGGETGWPSAAGTTRCTCSTAGHCRPIRESCRKRPATSARRAWSASRSDGQRIAVATATGRCRCWTPTGKRTVADRSQPGRQARRQTLDQETRRPDPLGPRHLAHQRRAGPQRLGEPDSSSKPRKGLILIDPNAGASFEQNWARIQGGRLRPAAGQVRPAHPRARRPCPGRRICGGSSRAPRWWRVPRRPTSCSITFPAARATGFIRRCPSTSR